MDAGRREDFAAGFKCHWICLEVSSKTTPGRSGPRPRSSNLPFVFNDFVLDPDRRELTRAAEPVSVGPLVFDLLLYLVRNRERVVSKDDLLDAVWQGRIVSESTLTSHINAARRAIGDTGGEQRLIRTVARKGFRFVGEVEEQPEGAATANVAADAAPDPHADALPLPEKPSIAVLPFLNLSGDPEQDYFTDGVV